MKLLLIAIYILLAGCNNNNNHPFPQTKQNQLLNLVLEKIEAEYLESPNIDKLAEGACNGMLNSLDNYSCYYTEKDFQSITNFANGEFYGVGIEIAPCEEGIMVIEVLDNTPAKKAGILAGDKIIKINSASLNKLSIQKSLSLLQEQPTSNNNNIKITVLRGKKQILNFALQKTKIISPEIKYEFSQVLAYIRIRSIFNKNNKEKVAQYLEKIAKNTDCKGLIIDIRNNPGGTLENGVDLANMLLSSGKIIVDVRSRNPAHAKTYLSNYRDIVNNLPIAVIVNNNTASAAEILAGALKDHKRAIIVGEKTFGKGSAQAIFALPEYKAGIKLTIARFYSPNGQLVQNVGITPNITVSEEKVIHSLKDFKTDKQISYAINYLLKNQKL